jgi:hypothetical protein
MGITCPVNDPEPLTLAEIESRFKRETTAKLRWIRYEHIEFLLQLITRKP